MSESLAVALASDACNLSWFSSLKSSYPAQWDSVESIEYERTDEYFDLHVPGAEHYLAEGIWHHNTGKTMGILQKVHLALSQHDGARGLVVRKTLNSLTSSGLVTYRHEVLHPLDIMQGKVHFFSGNKERPAQYEYDNGSVLVVGGLDNPDKVMSTQYDIMAIPESTELSERDWEQLSTRCRNGVMPYQQMLADCNPGPPHHWLKARCDRGDAAMLFSWHRDNPMIYAADGSLTARGVDYMRRLNRLTGVRKKRLLEGKWVAAEGIVYEELDREIHLLNRGDLPKTWQYFVGCDWGFTNPGCLTVWAMDGDGRLYEVEEVYQTRKLIDWWTEQAKRLQRKYHPRKFICDPSEPAYILQFEQAGLPVEPGFNEIRPGIEAVQERLQIADDGRPRLSFTRDCLIERDEELAEAFKPVCLDAEFDGYVWPIARDGRPLKEVPVDEDNHGLDSLRYVVCYVDKIGEERLTGNQTAVSGPRQIKGLPVSDRTGPPTPPGRTTPSPPKDIRKDYRIK